MSLSKRWTTFGGNRNSSVPTIGAGSSNYDSLQGFYRPDAPEAVMRRLADYAMMLRDYKLVRAIKSDQTVQGLVVADRTSEKEKSLRATVTIDASYEGDAGAAALLELAHVMGSLIMAYAFDIEKSETEEDDVDENDESYMTDDEDEQLPKGMVPLADLLNADADRNNVSQPAFPFLQSLSYSYMLSRPVFSRRKSVWS